jgi:hypothetical protein
VAAAAFTLETFGIFTQKNAAQRANPSQWYILRDAEIQCWRYAFDKSVLGMDKERGLPTPFSSFLVVL